MTSRKKSHVKKRVDLSIEIDLPKNHQADRLSYDCDSGTLVVFDKSGVPLSDLKVQRAVHYERPKGRKYQSLMQVKGRHISVSGMEELSSLHSFFVIDTNNRVIKGVRISVAVFIRLKVVPENGKFRVVPVDKSAFVYEFHNVPENSNPEMLAILKLANDVTRTERNLRSASIGFVTDSEMGSHKDISENAVPIYGRSYLPRCFRLIYASADTGQEALNHLIRFCDKTSTSYLDSLENSGLEIKNLKIVLEEPSVRFRCKVFPDVTIQNDLVNELTFNDDSQLSVQFE